MNSLLAGWVCGSGGGGGGGDGEHEDGLTIEVTEGALSILMTSGW